ncbi:nucleotidyl transferase AbiEii/AbiGii toxin family protein [Xenorhabdus japonica]|uniref:Predicted nucleotidyltransferase component of viral defense system n=1 Tax=Xenorhabdus japonica TaxID=53341 RepID=A0A1I5CCE3_9GAMM|nr:nucleotidyl transferase AbiEii/AbiGii toxin family protein [Xenorhabdus japonica]SFN84554.1 Predicted nucleotidyltransferase component of viral defense system [Xenorhabdus japonica]
MKIERSDFVQLVKQAMQKNTHISHMQPVIEKELLHYDILFCLDQAGLLDTLVFQGGTSLRLCYGGNRFSEDLDFAGGKDFSSSQLSAMKQCIEDYIGTRYDLKVTVKEPEILKQEPEYAALKISKWQISIITFPGRKDLPKQRIKIEVANIPAYTRNILPLHHNYDFLPDGYDDTLIYTETLDEIMADKLISLPATEKRVRHRDIWDLVWLQQQGAKLNVDLVKKKVADYKLTDFANLLDKRLQSLPDIIASDAFIEEMKRFLPNDVFVRTLAKEKFSMYLIATLTELFQKLQLTYAADHIQPEFKL